jgi:hypothetical protein
MEHKTYTQQEIDSAINILSQEHLQLVSERTEINALIREKKKNIKYYQSMNINQYKAF